MFGKLGNALGDIDPRKLKGVADAVWDIKDDLGDAVRFVVEHRDDLLRLVKNLPALLGDAGDAIETAGTAALRGATFLVGRNDGGVSAKDLAQVAGEAIDRCQKELHAATGVLERVGDLIDNIKIPSIEPNYSEVMGFKVVTGIDFGHTSLTDGAADQLRDGAQRLATIATDLGEVAQKLESLGGVFGDVGGDLDKVGHHLTKSGSTLRGLL